MALCGGGGHGGSGVVWCCGITGVAVWQPQGLKCSSYRDSSVAGIPLCCVALWQPECLLWHLLSTAVADNGASWLRGWEHIVSD